VPNSNNSFIIFLSHFFIIRIHTYIQIYIYRHTHTHTRTLIGGIPFLVIIRWSWLLISGYPFGFFKNVLNSSNTYCTSFGTEVLSLTSMFKVHIYSINPFVFFFNSHKKKFSPRPIFGFWIPKPLNKTINPLYLNPIISFEKSHKISYKSLSH